MKKIGRNFTCNERKVTYSKKPLYLQIKGVKTNNT